MKSLTGFLLVLGIILSAFPVPAIGAPQEVAVSGQGPSQDDAFRLGLVLKSARAYAKRLERAAMDFVCVEEVSEKLDLSRDTRQILVNQAPPMPPSEGISGQGGHSARMPALRPLTYDHRAEKLGKNTYLFDYQYVRKGTDVKEKRILLEENGKKAKKDAPIPDLATFQYADILLAPVKLLDDKVAEFYKYGLLREDVIDGAKAWAIEVTPRMSMADIYLGAVVWVKQDDGSILRIDWDTKTFGRYENILARAKAFDSDPVVTSRTEFKTEKHGLRFPSLDLTEEAYTGKDGKKFVRATTQVIYKDYKFFVVETETGVAK